MKIGYARVSTLDQSPQLQIAALEAAGCERIFVDRASGSDRNRPQLACAMSALRRGDVLVCWKLDRIARSLSHLLELVDDVERRAATFRSVTETIDTSSAIGRLIFHQLGAFAEFERALIRERVTAGLKARRARGFKLGLPFVLTDAMVDGSAGSLTTRARALGVHRSTLARFLARRRSAAR